jgi:hypothetical protein
MEEPRKKYEETRFTIILTAEEREMLEDVVSMAGIDYGSAIVTSLDLYRELLEDQKKKRRILIEHRSGKLEQIIL